MGFQGPRGLPGPQGVTGPPGTILSKCLTKRILHRVKILRIFSIKKDS